MPNESQIDRIEQMYGDLVRLGGQSERTGILTNVIVIDAAPTGLTGRVIIRDPRDGDYIPALTVPGIVYANNDLVNVLFVEGTEPIAYQQGSQSSGSNVKVYQIWESDFGAVAWSTNTTGDISAAGAYDITTTGDLFIGKIGIGTNAIPHGGIGAALLALDGANASLNGPHVQVTTNNDDYPLYQLLPYTHDNISISLDAYFDGAWKSSDAGSNFQLRKITDTLFMNYDSGVAAGSPITWNNGLTMDLTNGNVRVTGVFQADDIICDTNMYINDNSNAGQVIGLTINQGAQDDEILAFKSSDVAHGITSLNETDTYASFGKVSGTLGGLQCRGLTEGTIGLQYLGIATSGDTTKSTAAVAPFLLQGSKKTGTSYGAMGANENVLVVRDHASARFLVDAEGDIHYDATNNPGAWDAEDDTQVLRALSLAVSDPATIVRNEFDEFIRYHKDDLIKLGVLSEGGFINLTQVTRVMMGALWQQHVKIQSLEAKLNGAN